MRLAAWEDPGCRTRGPSPAPVAKPETVPPWASRAMVRRGMRLGQDVLTDLSAATAREWLITNGLGGYASGTAAGAHTRSSHALLVASGPHGRLSLVLLKLDERLHAGSESFDLACNLYAGAPPASPTVQPRPTGHLLLEEFRANPWPTWRWRAAGVTLEKSLFLVQGHHAVAVSYRHIDGPPGRLTVSPLLTTRAPDAVAEETDGMPGAAQAVPGRVRIERGGGAPSLSLWHSGAFMPARVWQRGLIYPADGAADRPGDSAFVPGYLECPLPVGGAFHVVAGIEEDLFRALAVEGRLGAPPPRTLAECVELLERGERDRVTRLCRAACAGADDTAHEAATAHGGPPRSSGVREEPWVDARDPWVPRLAQALTDGLIERGGRTTLLTSLPDGPERGADTLRALPALITLRAFEPAREVLRGYVEYLNEGLAPEGFDVEDGTPRYGDPAPALWLVHAAELLARRTEDVELVREKIYPAVESIVQSYRAGTHGGIRVGSEGLLCSGVGGTAAARADHNALWFHALVATAQLARLSGRKEGGAFYLAWAREHQYRVLEALWDEKRGCLHEALTPNGPRPGPSPSQLLAVSLSPPLLPAERPARLVETVERELFTPFGLRRSPGSDVVSTEWLGPFITAYLRVHQRSAEAQERARGWFATLHAQLGERWATHIPDSSPATASVLTAAELLRVWIEELDRGQQRSPESDRDPRVPALVRGVPRGG